MTEAVDEEYWLTLKRFGHRNRGMSENYVRKLIKEDIGPNLTRIGNRVFVSLDDEAEWREKMRNPRGKAAEKAVAIAKMCHERAKKASLAAQK